MAFRINGKTRFSNSQPKAVSIQPVQNLPQPGTLSQFTPIKANLDSLKPVQTNIGNSIAKNSQSLIKTAGTKGVSKGAVAGAAVSAVGSVAGGIAKNKGKEGLGGALSGASQGLSIGLSTGNPFAAVGGAVIGGIIGGVQGAKEQKTRERAEVTEINRVAKENATRKKDEKAYMTRLADSNRQNSLPMFKTGGIPDLKLPTSKSLSMGTKFKIPTFKRGGRVDLKKENVILGGPSHDEENNTGVKGDKGMPIVYNNVKVAELESEELILDAATMNVIRELREKIKNGKAKMEELGKFISSELINNTYDYRELEN